MERETGSSQSLICVIWGRAFSFFESEFRTISISIILRVIVAMILGHCLVGAGDTAGSKIKWAHSLWAKKKMTL